MNSTDSITLTINVSDWQNVKPMYRDLTLRAIAREVFNELRKQENAHHVSLSGQATFSLDGFLSHQPDYPKAYPSSYPSFAQWWLDHADGMPDERLARIEYERQFGVEAKQRLFNSYLKNKNT